MKPSLIATSKLIPRKAWMGAGFLSASLLGSLAGQPAAAYQATFNLQMFNVADQTTRTFIDGPPSNHTMVMSVTNTNPVTTDPIFGLCNISPNCGTDNSSTADNFSFSKPTQGFSFKVGRNVAPSGGWNSGGISFLRLRVNNPLSELYLLLTWPQVVQFIALVQAF